MRWRDEYDPGHIPTASDPQSVGIDWHSDDFGIGGLQRRECTAIPRTFDPCEVARIDHDLGDQCYPRLSGWYDDDLLGPRPDAANVRKMLQQHLLQVRVIVRSISPSERIGRGVPEAPTPDGVRELALVCETGLERSRPAIIDGRPESARKLSRPWRQPKSWRTGLHATEALLTCHE